MFGQNKQVLVYHHPLSFLKIHLVYKTVFTEVKRTRNYHIQPIKHTYTLIKTHWVLYGLFTRLDPEIIVRGVQANKKSDFFFFLVEGVLLQSLNKQLDPPPPLGSNCLFHGKLGN